jgi:nucleoside 2-deoxyribosyltransferase
MTEQPTVYMAGPIQHAADKGKGWRARVRENFDGIEWLDPMDKYDPTKAEKQLRREWTDEQIVEEDKRLIDDCDALLIHYEKVPSWGTPREQEYAVERDIPVFVQTTEDDPSPWLTVDAEVVASTFAETVGALKAHFKAEVSA